MFGDPLPRSFEKKKISSSEYQDKFYLKYFPLVTFRPSLRSTNICRTSRLTLVWISDAFLPVLRWLLDSPTKILCGTQFETRRTIVRRFLNLRERSPRSYGTMEDSLSSFEPIPSGTIRSISHNPVPNSPRVIESLLPDLMELQFLKRLQFKSLITI